MRSAGRCISVVLGLCLAAGGAAELLEIQAGKDRGRGRVARPAGRSPGRVSPAPVKARGGTVARKSSVGRRVFSRSSNARSGTSKGTTRRATGATKPAGRPSGGTKPGAGSPTRVDGHGHWGYHGGQSYGHYSYYSGYPYAYAYWGWPLCWGWPYYPGGWYVSYPPDPGHGYHPALATVELDVKPKKAQVRLDGDLMGQAKDYNGTWDVLWVKPGGHQIEFSLAGYRTLSFWVEVQAGSTYRFSDRMLEGEGLDVRSTGPPPEEPAVDRRGAGEPAIELRGESFAPREGRLRSGFLRIEAHPADAAVYLDGEFLARADELSRLHGALSVALGTHVIEVVRPGYESQSATVEVSDKEPVEVVVRLRR